MALLEEEAREPHQAAFEAARADLEEQQLQLQDLIQDMKSRLAYVNSFFYHTPTILPSELSTELRN